MQELINRIKQNNAAVWVEENALKAAFSSDSADLELVAQLKAHKESLITYLTDLEITSQDDFSQLHPELNWPLSYAQKGLLFIERLEQGTSAYHLPYLVRLEEHADIAKIEAAINEVASRHLILKSIYKTTEEGLDYQIPIDQTIIINSITCKSSTDWYNAMRYRIQQPFDLAEEIPLKVTRYLVGGEAYLLFVWHHIATDGWSTNLFINELSTVYESKLNGSTPQLPKLPIQYSDYARWQNETFHCSKKEQAHLDYWMQKLAELPQLDMPLDYQRPEHFDYCGNDLKLKLSHNLSNDLRELSRNQGTTLYTVMLSAFFVTLGAFCHQDDIVVGSPSENRALPETQSLIGFFANSIVMRAKLDHQHTVSELIGKIHQTVAEAKKHQSLPFDLLVDSLEIARNPALHPIFQVMFTLQHFGEDTQCLPWVPVQLDSKSGVYSPAKFDLSLYVSDNSNELSLTFNYATSLFASHCINQISEVYVRVLKQFVKSPKKRLKQIEFLDALDKKQLLTIIPSNVDLQRSEMTLAQAFEQQVLLSPNKTAVVFQQESLTYSELNILSNKLAHELIQTYQGRYGKPISAGSRIALYLDRGSEMLISILAVLKTSAAYVPISPEHPRDRVKYLIDDSGASMIVTDQTHCSFIDAICGETSLCPEVVLSERCRESGIEVNPTQHCATSDLAYIIYTSGTTGRPKGVAISHHSSMSRNLYMAEKGKTQGDTYLFKTNYIFDVSVSDIFAHLLVGATLVVSPTDFNIFDLPNIIQAYGITACHLVPSQFSALYAANITLTGLKKLYFSGENLSNEHLSKLDLQAINTINYYGPTETGEVTLYHPRNGTDGNIIGKPFPDHITYVVAKNGMLAPVNSVGELWISGPGVALGYINLPDLTHEKFAPNPFLSLITNPNSLHERVYKTGDLVKRLSNGNLEYAGRADSQLKIRGQRVELSEIKQVLLDAPLIRDAVVIYQKSEPKHLAAYMVSQTGKEIDLTSIKTTLADRLPEFMHPNSYTQLDTLPLTINGKLDVSALPKAVFEQRSTYAAPRNEQEQSICTIWQEVLNQGNIGIDDDFFAVGGNSLLVFQTIKTIQSRLGLTYTVRDFYTKKTIRALCENAFKTQKLSWEQETKLDPKVALLPKDKTLTSQKHILLTGATGFVGKYLLIELLKNTDADVFCLLRGNDKVSALKRLIVGLEEYNLWDASFKPRIHIVLGDLSQTLLGIPPKQYNSLAATIGSVYHAAVFMHHLATFDTMKATNVTGTAEILRFCCTSRNKKLAAFSTVGIFTRTTQSVANENTPLDIQYHQNDEGYCSTKWISEGLILKAIARGLDCKIFRLGLIGGDQKHGKNEPTQWFSQLLRTCRLSGVAFDDQYIDVSTLPVDYIARSSVSLMKQGDMEQRVFHLASPYELNLKDIICKYNNHTNNSIELISFQGFIKQLKVQLEQGKSVPVPYFIRHYFTMSNDELNQITFEGGAPKICSKLTQESLESIGIHVPTIDDRFLKNYFY
ncbi:non-ribosomal peptide synthetase [Vibrio neptunius]|uniref:non-ribosomal peptide synthetase n=1 Tax=Vibrio neptunius TaxID=170651 RepID=UPI0019D03976|nr:non-ribosomal peptide synthetase [Vibrio neptunius]MBN3573247.1 amino acid adenylation domain-containing protein [Vibrio neptunius]